MFVLVRSINILLYVNILIILLEGSYLFFFQPSYSPVDCLSQVEELTNQVIIPFMTSRSFQAYLSQIR